MCATAALPPTRPLKLKSTVKVSPLTVMSAAPVAGDAFGGTAFNPDMMLCTVNDAAWAGGGRRARASTTPRIRQKRRMVTPSAGKWRADTCSFDTNEEVVIRPGFLGGTPEPAAEGCPSRDNCLT